MPKVAPNSMTLVFVSVHNMDCCPAVMFENTGNFPFEVHALDKAPNHFKREIRDTVFTDVANVFRLEPGESFALCARAIFIEAGEYGSSYKMSI